jgi:hypothetical protein
MHKFTDRMNREWVVEFDHLVRCKVLRDTEYDLYGVIDPTALAKLADLELQVKVLYAICEEQVVKTGLSYEQFVRGLGEDTLEKATQGALMGAVGDFFTLSKRQVLNAILEKGEKIGRAAAAAILEKVNAANENDIVQRMLNGTSTNSPGSSESIQSSAASQSAD